MYNSDAAMLAVGMEIPEEVRANVRDEAALEARGNDALAVTVV